MTSERYYQLPVEEDSYIPQQGAPFELGADIVRQPSGYRSPASAAPGYLSDYVVPSEYPGVAPQFTTVVALPAGAAIALPGVRQDIEPEPDYVGYPTYPGSIIEAEVESEYHEPYRNTRMPRPEMPDFTPPPPRFTPDTRMPLAPGPKRHEKLPMNRRSKLLAMAAGALVSTVLVGGTSYSMVLSPSAYEYSGTVPEKSGDHYQVYPMQDAQGNFQWPLVLKPFSNINVDQVKAAQAGIDPNQLDEKSLAIIQAEVRDVVQGQVKCKDGRVLPYVTIEKLSIQDIIYNKCGESDKAPEAQKSKNIEKAAKAPPPARNTGNSIWQPPNCQALTNGDRIYCNAQKYGGIFYKWAGGHEPSSNSARAAFVKSCKDPRRPANNRASGAPARNHYENPSPCGLDCSGLVSMAVDDSFNIKKTWLAEGPVHDRRYWKPVPLNEAKRGYAVTKTNGQGTYHIELVSYLQKRKGQRTVVHTFGTRERGAKSGTTFGYFDSTAYRYVGPGSTA
jgi:hypothetical protein